MENLAKEVIHFWYSFGPTKGLPNNIPKVLLRIWAGGCLLLGGGDYNNICVYIYIYIYIIPSLDQ